MRKLDYILKNINVLNVLLLALSITMYFTLAYPLLNTDIQRDSSRLMIVSVSKEKNMTFEDILPSLNDFILTEKSISQPLLLADVAVNVAKSKDMTARVEKKIATENVPTSLDYIVVAEKNLFHPERCIPTEKKEEPVVVRPEIIYYGSIITSEKKIAYIEDKKNPYSTPGRGKRQTPLAEGAMIGGYTLREVNPETLVLVRGDDKMVVNLRDQKDRKPGEATFKSQSASGRNYAPPPLPRPTSATAPGAIPPPIPARPVIQNR